MMSKMNAKSLAFIGLCLIFGVVKTSDVIPELRIPDNTKHDAEYRLRKDLKLFGWNLTAVLPPHTDTSPVTVAIGLNLRLVREMDVASQTLTSEAWINLNWNDTRITWDPSKYEGVDVIRVRDHRLWQPDIKLYNAAKAEDMDKKGNVYVMLYNTGSIWWIPPITMYSTCEMDLKHYPYDEHSCNMTFGSWTMDGYHIDLRAKQFYTDDIKNSGGEWEVLSGTSLYEKTYYDCCDEPYPSVTFTVVLRRRSPFYKMAVLFPVLSAITLVLTSLCLSPFSPHRITLNVLGLALLVLQLLHLEFKLPSVGNSPPIIASFCGWLVILVTLTTVLTVCIVSFLGMTRHDNRSVPTYVKTFLNLWPVKMIGPNGPVQFSFVPFKYHQETEKLDSTTSDAENPFDGPNANNENYEEWLGFFQIVDRLVFLLFVLVNVIVLFAVAI